MRLCLENLIQENELMYADCSRYDWSNLRLVGNTDDNGIVYKYIANNKIPLTALPTVHSTITERIMDYILEGFKPENPSDLVKFIESKLNIHISMDITNEDEVEEIPMNEVKQEPVEEEPVMKEVEDFAIEKSECVPVVEEEPVTEEPLTNKEPVTEEPLTNSDCDEVDIINSAFDEIEEKVLSDIEEQETVTDCVQYVMEKDIDNSSEEEEVEEEEIEVEEEEIEEEEEEIKEEKEEIVENVVSENNVIDSAVSSNSEEIIIRNQASSLERLVNQDIANNVSLKQINNKLDTLTKLVSSIKTDVEVSQQRQELKENKSNTPNVPLDMKMSLYLSILEKLKGDVVAETLSKVIRRAIDEDKESLEVFLQTFFEEL